MHIEEIAALVRERYGLVPRPRWAEELQTQIVAMARARGTATRDMALQILRSPELLASLVGELTIKESYFFRQSSHFEYLVAAVRRALARPSATFRVWSAGCASGEEPYSIAIALRDALTPNDLPRVTILATDADRNAIAAAVAGRYSRWAFRGVRPDLVHRHFRQCSAQLHELDPEVRRLVTFRHASAQAHLADFAEDSLDAIFFRNVSVYLTQQAISELNQQFARVLRPGGHLFVAATDARPTAGAFRAALPDDTTVFECLAAASARPKPLARVHPRVEQPPSSTAQPSASRPAAASDLASSSGIRPRASEGWRIIDDLADRGELARALALVAQRVAAGDDAEQAYLRQGSIHLASGDYAAAVADFRRVLYLDPDNTAARYWYALALRRAGHEEAAQHQLRLVAGAPGDDNEALRSTARALMEGIA